MDIYGEASIQVKLEGIYHNRAFKKSLLKKKTVVILVDPAHISVKSVHVWQFRTSAVFTLTCIKACNVNVALDISHKTTNVDLMLALEEKSGVYSSSVDVWTKFCANTSSRC